MRSNYDPNPNELELARIGRNLMDQSLALPKKGHKLTNEDIARSNRMSAFGDTLTRVGTLFGPKELQDILKTSGVEVAEAAEFLKLGGFKA